MKILFENENIEETVTDIEWEKFQERTKKEWDEFLKKFSETINNNSLIAIEENSKEEIEISSIDDFLNLLGDNDYLKVCRQENKIYVDTGWNQYTIQQ